MPLKLSVLCFLFYAVLTSSFKVHAQCSSNATVTGSFLLVSGSGNGTILSPFSPGSIIRITLNVGGTYSQNGSNWWHGVQINLGNDFAFANPLNLNVTGFPANSRWIWSNGHTGNGPGAAGPGVYYDADTDGDPANNYGRNTTTLAGTIRFNIIATGTPTTSGTITTNIMSDGFSGNWSTSVCDNDASPAAAITALSNIVLPATLISLKAKPVNNKDIELSWETATEQNVSHFVIEHSSDGRNWSNIGTRTAIGNSSILQSYSYLHNTPTGAEHFYRIKIVDRDGRFEYSKIVSLKKEFNSAIFFEKVYPNPVNNKLALKIISPLQTSGELVIYNSTGAQVSSMQISLTKGLNEFSYDTKQWQKGIYLVRFVNESANISEKIVKN